MKLSIPNLGACHDEVEGVWCNLFSVTKDTITKFTVIFMQRSMIDDLNKVSMHLI